MFDNGQEIPPEKDADRGIRYMLIAWPGIIQLRSDDLITAMKDPLEAALFSLLTELVNTEDDSQDAGRNNSPNRRYEK